MNNSIQTWLNRANDNSTLIEQGELDEGYRYFIVKNPCADSGLAGYNGYILFPKRLTVESGYNGILSYVPVHGGITFTEDFDEGVVYGFDTAHYNSAQFPRTDINWIKEQIAIMLRGIQKAAAVEKRYLVAKNQKTRAKYAQMVADVAPETEMGFGALINCISGQL